MKTLSIAKQQMVEIAKAISYDAKIIIMDEPTSAIPEREVEHLHRMIKRLTDFGVAIIYITHKMDEVFKISDDITIFRDGKHVGSYAAKDLDRDKLIKLMVGRELTDLFPKLEARSAMWCCRCATLRAAAWSRTSASTCAGARSSASRG